MTVAVEAALRRHRALTIGALAVLVLLAWGWLLSGAGMDEAGTGGMAMEWSPARVMLTFSMWWVMMLAMMLPAAAPTILLYARAAGHGAKATRPATEAFLAGYLLVWGGYSLAATGLQWWLEQSDLLAPMLMTSNSRWLTGAILIAAGIYQLSPLKDVCLRHCRSPAQFLSRHYREGSLGGLRMGLVHGTYCVGCCWLLMALLFVGGVMNLAWIALLALMVAAEKLLPFGRYVTITTGMACMAWGALILIG